MGFEARALEINGTLKVDFRAGIFLELV